MSETITLRVWFDPNVGMTPFVEPPVIELTGRPDDTFEAALTRTFGAPPTHHRFNLVRRHGQDTLEWLGEITSHVTLRDAAAFADGEVLQVDLLGRGGGAIPLMWDLVNGGLTLIGVAQSAAWVTKRIDAGRLRSKRLAAREWVDAGVENEPSMLLTQFVFENPEWRRRAFDKTFALDRAEGSALLTRLGYTKAPGIIERWVEPAQE